MSALKAWNISRATGLGVMAGLASIILWPLHAAWPETLFWPFVAALALTFFAGASMLLITGKDMFRRRRGMIMQRIRTFDIVLGLLLAIPSLLQLETLLRGL